MASDSDGSENTSQTGTLTSQYIQVQFTDTSSGADSVLWDFGDGNTSTERNPKHTYTDNGDYNVILTVTNSAGQAVSQENVQITGVGASSEGEGEGEGEGDNGDNGGDNGDNGDNGGDNGDNGDNEGETEIIYGCTDPLALNYDEYANRDDNSCEYSTSPEPMPSYTPAGFNPPIAMQVGARSELGRWTWTGAGWILTSDYQPPEPPQETIEQLQGTLIRDFAEPNVWNVNNPSNPSLVAYLKAPQQISARAIDDVGNPGQPLGTFTLTNTLLVNNRVTLLPPISTGISQVTFQASITVVGSGDGDNGGDDGGGDPAIIYGCTDSSANNYDRHATVDDGSCEYSSDF